jgi:hypothetical protein
MNRTQVNAGSADQSSSILAVEACKNVRWERLELTVNSSTDHFDPVMFGRESPSNIALLEPEAFLHEALQAGLIQQVVGEFFVGEHGESGALGSGGQF